MKKILLILLLGIAGFIPESVCAADAPGTQAETPKMENVQLDMRDYDEVEVPGRNFYSCCKRSGDFDPVLPCRI